VSPPLPAREPAAPRTHGPEEARRGPTLSTPYCRAELASEGPEALLRFAGALLGEEAEPLATFLEKVHARLLELRCREVTLDFRRFELVSPIAFNGFVHWVSLVQAAPATARYRIRFLADKERTWQRVALYVLQGLSGDIVAGTEAS